MSRRNRRRRKAHAQSAIVSAAPASALEPVTAAAPARVASEPALLIRAADTQEDIAAIHAFMLANAAAEMAQAPVDAIVCMETIWHTFQTGACLMAGLDGKLIGYLGLIQSQYDHSRDYFMHDKWFFVLPEHRDGVVARALLNEAKGIAAHAHMTLKIIDTTPKKRRAIGQMALTAEIIGFHPHGRIFTVYPSRTN